MTLKTRPAFYYGFQVTADCNYIDFKESELGPTISMEIPVGVYTLEELRSVLQSEFNRNGSYNYTVTADRYTRKITILTNNAFKLLLQSGPNVSSSLLLCLGFGSTPVWGEDNLYGQPLLEFGTPDTGLQFAHTSQYPVGFSYEPTYCPQDYVDAENNRELREASVNESIDGNSIEVLYFGVNENYEFNFKYITNLKMPVDGPIRNNPKAVEEINSFMKWVIEKKKLEFIPDIQNPNIYHTIRIEKTRSGKGGTGYRLKEMVPKLPEFYETGKLIFRRI